VLLGAAFAVGLALLLLPAGATPALAHAGGLTSSASEATVVGLDPPVPGLRVRAVEFGARLRLDNGTGVPVVVDAGPTVEPGATAYWVDPRITAAVQYTMREDDVFPTGLVTSDLTRAYPALKEWQQWGMRARERPEDRPPSRARCG